MRSASGAMNRTGVSFVGITRFFFNGIRKKYDKEVEYDEINYSKFYYVDGKHKNVYNMS